MRNKKKQEIKNKKNDEREPEEKPGKKEIEEPSTVEKVETEVGQKFQSFDDSEESLIPSEVLEYTLQGDFPTLVEGVFNSLVFNAFKEKFLIKDGLTVQMLENKFDQSSRSSILHALSVLKSLNIAVEGKVDDYGKRYYKLQTDFTTWKPMKPEGKKA